MIIIIDIKLKQFKHPLITATKINKYKNWICIEKKISV